MSVWSSPWIRKHRNVYVNECGHRIPICATKSLLKVKTHAMPHARSNSHQSIFICVLLHAIENRNKCSKYVQITRWKLNECDCKMTTMWIVCIFGGDCNRPCAHKNAIAVRRICRVRHVLVLYGVRVFVELGKRRRWWWLHVAPANWRYKQRHHHYHVNHYLFIYLYYGWHSTVRARRQCIDGAIVCAPATLIAIS